MAKTYRVDVGVRLSNALVTLLLRTGFRLGNMALLTVRGRKSGLPRTTPVTISEHNGQRYLIGAFGDVQWVRNLRAAGDAILSHGRRTEHITVVELPPAQAAPLLQDSLKRAPSFIRAYFDVTPMSALAAFEQEAPRHPVFRVQSKPTVAH